MYLFIWIVFGGFVGWIASILTHNNNRMGIIANIAVGLIGSALGGWIASLAGIASVNDFSFWGFCFAILGAVVFLSLINLFSRKGRR